MQKYPLCGHWNRKNVKGNLIFILFSILIEYIFIRTAFEKVEIHCYIEIIYDSFSYVVFKIASDWQ